MCLFKCNHSSFAERRLSSHVIVSHAFQVACCPLLFFSSHDDRICLKWRYVNIILYHSDSRVISSDFSWTTCPAKHFDKIVFAHNRWRKLTHTVWLVGVSSSCWTRHSKNAMQNGLESCTWHHCALFIQCWDFQTVFEIIACIEIVSS